MPPKKNGYKMPGQLPKGSVLQDVFKKQYKLGASIGKGGFGEIYSAQQVGQGKSTEYPYVVKIEPHSNGPLFVEMHFYTRNAKKADIEAFMESKKMKNLGMPSYVASGSHEHDGEKYRFLVMEKFATDISKLFVANNEKFPEASVYKLGLQIMDVLEYIHSRGYIHADIKGANILLSCKNQNQSYLVDFGLASKFTNDTVFKPNPKKMHDGTIEYLSRDAHQGVQTRRGDLEILAYNMIHWLGSKLPWHAKLTDSKVVQASKEKHMSDINLFMKTCFGANAPDAIVQFLEYIKALKFNEAPNYTKIQDILKSGLKEAGGTISSPLLLKSTTKRKSDASTPLKPKKAKKVESDCEEEPTVNARGTPRRKATKAANVEEEKPKSKTKTTNRRKVKKQESDDDKSEDEKVKKITSRRKVVNKSEESDEEDKLSKKVNVNKRRVKKALSEDESEIVSKTTPRRNVVKSTPRKNAKKSDSDESMEAGINSESEAGISTPIKVRRKAKASQNITPTLIEADPKSTPKSTRKLYDKENDEIPARRNSDEATEKKVVPMKRTRRVNTVSTIDDNGVVHNSEMMRIKSLMAVKNGRSARAKPSRPKFNRSFGLIEEPDVISGSDDDEYVPLVRRVGRLAVAK